MDPRKPQTRTHLAWILGIPLLIILIILIRLKFIGNKDAHHVVPPVAVVVDKASSRDVPIYLDGLGSVTPTYTITVKTQIDGQLLQVLYKEGQMVKAGQQIAQIDPRPYEAQLIQYEGQLVRDTALLANALIDLKRYQTLWKQDSISQQTLATQISLVEQYQGAVKTDEGLIEGTKINLIYCRITSPVDGRIGLRLVDPGNFVQTTDPSGLAVITTLNPMTAIFTLAEDTVPQVLPQIMAKKALQAQAYDRQQIHLLAIGTLLTIDNQIDPTTGTVKLRAIFDNKDNALFPSQFVNVKLLINTLKNATIVPTAAVQYSTKSDFVYVLNDDQTVTVNPVSRGNVTGEYTVIKSGLLPGQIVVVDGTDKLTDGAKVAVANAAKTLPDLKTKAPEHLSLNITTLNITTLPFCHPTCHDMSPIMKHRFNSETLLVALGNDMAPRLCETP